MNSAPLNLKAGDHVSTTFNHGRESIHSIVASKIDAHCQSGVMYRVMPDLGGWIDAAWFKPVDGFTSVRDLELAEEYGWDA